MEPTTDGGAVASYEDFQQYVEFGTYPYAQGYNVMHGRLVKISADGASQQIIALQPSNSLISQVQTIVKPTPDGGYLTRTIEYDFTSYANYLGYIIRRLDSTGKLLWKKKTRIEQANDWSFTLMPDGGFVAYGTAGGNVPGNHGQTDYGLAKYSADGTEEWIRNYGGNNTEQPTKLTLTPDNGFLLGGTANAYDSKPSGNVSVAYGGADLWIVKLGCPAFTSPANTIVGSQTACQQATPRRLTGPALTVPTGEEIRYEWQASVDNGATWATLPNTNQPDYQPQATAVTTLFRRIVACDTSNVVTLTINEFQAPIASAGDPFVVCPGGQVVIGGNPTAAGGTAPYRYDWTPTTGLNDASLANPTATPPGSGVIYTLEVTDANGCRKVEQTTVQTVRPNAGPDKTICQAGQVQIGTPGIPGGSVQYAWSQRPSGSTAALNNPALAQPVVSLSTVGSYTFVLTMSGPDHCPLTDEVIVTVGTKPVADAGDVFVCEGTPVTLGTPEVPGQRYSWVGRPPLGATEGISAGSVAQPTHDGLSRPSAYPQVYYLTVQDAAGACSSVDSARVFVIQANAGADGCGPRQLGIPDVSQGQWTYQWTVVSGDLSSLDNQTAVAQPTVAPSVPTVYRLTVSYGGVSCTDEVTVPACQCRPYLFTDRVAVNCATRQLVWPHRLTGLTNQIDTTQYQITWSPATYLNNPNSPQPTISSAPAGAVLHYTATITPRSQYISPYPSECPVTYTVQVPLFGNYTLPVLPAQVVCPDASAPLRLGDSPIAGVFYSWSPAARVDSIYAAQPRFISTLPNGVSDTTFVMVQTVQEVSTGCPIATRPQLVNVRRPLADAGPDLSFCESTLARLGTPARPEMSYLWQPGLGLSDSTAAQPTIQIYTPLTFYLTVTDTRTGCLARDTISFYQGTVPSLALSSDRTLCQGQSVMIGDTDSQTEGYTYQWLPGTGLSSTSQPQVQATPQATTTYTLIKRPANSVGCEVSGRVRLLVNTPAALNISAGNDQQVCKPSSLTVVLGEPAQPNRQYRWTPTYGLSDATTAQPVLDVSSLGAGVHTYTLAVLDTVACAAGNAQVVVTIVEAPSMLAGYDQTICPGVATQPLGQNSQPDYSYQWTPAEGLSNATGAQPVARPTTTTAYTVAATHTPSGCVFTDEVLVTVWPKPVVSAGADLTICSGWVQLGGGGNDPNLSYAWSPYIGLNYAYQANPYANPSATTTYVVRATDYRSGCFAQDTVTVTVPAPIDAGPDQFICAGNSARLGTPAGAGLTYQWAPAFGLSDPNVAQPMASPGYTTFYTLTVSDARGCQRVDYVLVNVQAKPSSVVTADKSIVCQNESVQLNASPPDSYNPTYQWSPASLLNDASLPNPVATLTRTTTFTVVVTNHRGCQSVETITVSVNSRPSPVADAGPDRTVCYGQLTTLGTPAVAGLNYAWTPTDALELSAYVAQPTVRVVTPTTYALVVTDPVSGCQNRDEVVITPQRLSGRSTADQAVCRGNSVPLQMNVTGGNLGLTYAWSPATGLSSTTVSAPVATPAVTTVYQVTATDPTTGCQVQGQTTLTVAKPAAITIDVPTTYYACSGDSIQINLTPRPGYSYQWLQNYMSGFSATDIANPKVYVMGQTATLLITDSSATAPCNTASFLFTFNTLTPILVSATGSTVCRGQNAQLVVSSPYYYGSGIRYQWLPAEGLSDPTSLQPVVLSPNRDATYQVRAYYDAVPGAAYVGCEATASATIRVINPPQVTVSDITTCSDKPIKVLLTPLSSDYSYYWSPADGLSDAYVGDPYVTPSTTKDYTVTVYPRAATNCASQATLRVTVINAVEAGPDLTTCGSMTATLPSPSSGLAWRALGGNPAPATVDGQGRVSGLSQLGAYRFELFAQQSSACRDTLTLTVTACAACPVAIADVSELTLCAGDSWVPLSVQVPSGYTVDWYDAATDGILLATDTLQYVPSREGTYWAATRAVGAPPCEQSTRSAIVVRRIYPVCPKMELTRIRVP